MAKRPAQTRRARQLRGSGALSSSNNPSTDPSDEPERDRVRLTVVFDKAGGWRSPIRRAEPVEPWRYWPDEDEAPWPDLDSSRSLQWLADALNGPESTEPPIQALLADAEADGLGDTPIETLTEQPWTALVAMQAAHLAEVLDGGFLDCSGSTDHSRSLALATTIADRWPEDPAADYARLHLLWIHADECLAHYDPDAAIESVMTLVASTEDAVVLEAAVSLVGRLAEDIGDEELDEISDAWPDMGPTFRASIASLQVERALTAMDAEALEAWAPRLQRLMEKRCIDEPQICSILRDSWTGLQGHRISQGERDPADWREEISAVVHGCHARTPLDAVVQVTGHWSDGWQWSAWSAASILELCLTDAHWTHAPPPDIDVRLVVCPDVELLNLGACWTVSLPQPAEPPPP